MSEELELLDHRRRVFALYAEVRALAPRAGHERWRAARDELFARHPQSALPGAARAVFRGLKHFDYDERFRFLARVRPLAGERFDIATSTGEALTLRRFGIVDLPIGSLEVYWIDVYGGGVLLPFRDATSGSDSYAGGRYVLDTVKGADLGSTASGELIIDLNFAYAPSCAYDARWSCPLAPRENWLTVPVSAGESSYQAQRYVRGT